MKKMIFKVTVMSIAVIIVWSCSGKNDQKIPEEFKPLPQKIEISQTDTCIVDTFLVDTLTIDSTMLEIGFNDTTLTDTVKTDTAAVQSEPEKIKNDLTELGLKAKVKSLNEETFKAADKFGEIIKGQKEGVSRSITFYNNGMIAEEQNIQDKKSVSGKRNMYDNKGNKIENAYGADGKIDNTKMIIYDEKGNITEETIYNSSGILESKYRYKYDSKNNMIEQDIYNSEGNISGTELYVYDDKGNKTEENMYNSEGDLTDSHKFIYENDGLGNLTIKDIYKTDGAEYTEWKKIDAKGNKIEEGSGKTGDADQSLTKYKYDENGSVIEEHLNNPEQFLKYKYEYDSHGNWVKKITFEKQVGIPQSLTERKILYYE